MNGRESPPLWIRLQTSMPILAIPPVLKSPNMTYFVHWANVSNHERNQAAQVSLNNGEPLVMIGLHQGWGRTGLKRVRDLLEEHVRSPSPIPAADAC